VYFLYLTWLLWKSVVTLVVTGNTIPVGFFGVLGVPEFGRHRLLLTGSRCYKQWLIDRRTKPIFCVFPVFSVAVMERGCDACRDREYYYRSVFLASENAEDREALTAVDRKMMADRSSNEPDFLCNFFIYRIGYGKVL
jgi:hypothetical protein